MHLPSLKRLSCYALVGALTLSACATFTGCAEQIGDIDRTQPNKLKKSDLVGRDWFMAQTVTEVPATSWFTFPGETSTMERVRWEVREDKLIAYRVYSRLEGADPDVAREGETYTESPVAAFPITSHFDVQRQYNTATGEQSNIIVENASDRPWYERDYIRVDWSTNLIVNFDFIATPANVSGVSYFVPEEQGGADAMVTTRDAKGALSYFDITSKVAVEPDFWGCLYAYYGWSAEDCTAAEIKVRTSFLHAATTREYEPAQYDDRLMSKFGYFRTERFGFDPWRGITQSGRVQLANRHPLWEQVWRRDDDGEIVRDASGRPQAIPMKDRTPRPIVYHASKHMPESIIASSQEVAASWDLAFREAVATALQKPLSEVPTMFAMCHNPVAAGDDPACGEEGLEVRVGDIRYNHMVWVDRPTQAGLLGYGPSGADPLTGEIVFGAAYVYGTEVDTYAQYAADLVRLIRGDLTDADLRMPSYIQDDVRARLGADPSRPKLQRAAALKGKRPSADIRKLLPASKAQRLTKLKRVGLEAARPGAQAARLKKIADAGLDHLLINDELVRGRTRGKFGGLAGLPADKLGDVAPTSWASAQHLDQQRLRVLQAARHNLYLSAFADDAIVGLAKSLQDASPEEVRETVRKAIYRAVMEHEVGHTIGLRHNFQGSYDALNFHDTYWDLRKENLKADPTIDDLYAMSQPTQAQLDGRMHEHAYSSIMDYGMRFNSDTQGIGKYDHAAILFGYTTGTHDAAKGVEPGYVQTYTNTGNAHTRLKRFEDQPSLAYDILLEQFHYSTLALSFPSIEAMRERQPVLYDTLLAQRAAQGVQAPAEVPFMFCSDEWVGALVSCQVFDAGADPFEIVMNTINNYKNYYAVHHWARDRAFFWSEDVLNSMYGRYFSQLTHVYQQWVFAYFYDTSDVTLDNYYLFAAMSGFNQLADVLQTPAIGGYARGDDGVWRIASYNTEPRPSDDLFVSYADGREVFSEYQYDSGYYLFDRIDHVGHFWDYLGALFALTDSDATRLGVDTAADQIAYSIPWYMFFEQELTQMMAGAFVRDPRVFGPRVEIDGTITRRPIALLSSEDDAGNEILFDPATGAEISEVPTGEPLELDTSYTQELYGVLYGMAFFTSNYSLNFPDQWRIFRVGSGEELIPGPGFQTITFTDPNNGITYGALRSTASNAQLSGAAHLITKANEWATIARTSDDEDVAAEAAYYRDDMIERINLVRSFYEVLGTVF